VAWFLKETMVLKWFYSLRRRISFVGGSSLLVICHIGPEMLWIHYLVGVGHFAVCRENQPATVCEKLIYISYNTIFSGGENWGK